MFPNNRKGFDSVLRSQNVTSNYGGRRYLPYAYTEEGIIVLAGNPAKVIRKRFNDETIELLEKLEGWNRNERQIQKLIPLLCSSDINHVKEEIKRILDIN